MSKNIVIDNGSYELKYGYTTQPLPNHIPNCVIRTPDKRILLGENITNLTDYSGVQFKRPIEKGQLTQWFMERQIWDSAFAKLEPSDDFLIDANVILSQSGYSLDLFNGNTDQVMFEEYGVRNYYRCTSASLIPWNDFKKKKEEEDVAEVVPQQQDKLENGDSTKSKKKEGGSNTTKPPKYASFQLVIDLGFDSTWIIPIVYGIPYTAAVKKIPVAGRFLTSYLREMVSFRHYNVTEETVLVNNIKEQTCFVTQDYNSSLSKVENLRRHPKLIKDDDVVVDYVLPDYKTSSTGYVLNEATKLKTKMDQAQLLRLYDERFAIPEVLFHPEVTGVHKAGLVRSIQDCIRDIPELLRPLLLANIVLCGGTASLPGLKERLAQELRKEVPIDNKIRVFDHSDIDIEQYGSGGDAIKSQDLAWFGGVCMFDKGGFEKVCVSKSEYLENGVNYCREKFGSFDQS